MQAIKRNWKTTLLGIATLLMVAAKCYANPSEITNAETVTHLTAAAAMILAKDA